MATENWDSAYEATPANTDKRHLGDDEFRDMKRNIRESLMQGGHWDPNAGAVASTVENDRGRHVVDAGGSGVSPHIYQSDGTTKLVEYTDAGVAITGTLGVSGTTTFGPNIQGPSGTDPVVMANTLRLAEGLGVEQSILSGTGSTALGSETRCVYDVRPGAGNTRTFTLDYTGSGRSVLTDGWGPMYWVHKSDPAGAIQFQTGGPTIPIFYDGRTHTDATNPLVIQEGATGMFLVMPSAYQTANAGWIIYPIGVNYANIVQFSGNGTINLHNYLYGATIFLVECSGGNLTINIDSGSSSLNGQRMVHIVKNGVSNILYLTINSPSWNWHGNAGPYTFRNIAAATRGGETIVIDEYNLSVYTVHRW